MTPPTCSFPLHQEVRRLAGAVEEAQGEAKAVAGRLSSELSARAAFTDVITSAIADLQYSLSQSGDDAGKVRNANLIHSARM